MDNLKNITALILFALLLSTTHKAQADTDQYFGNIRYNHVSPHVEIKGVNPLSQEQLKNRPYYIFSYAENNKLTAIINKSYNVKKRHHLASFGAYKVTFSYENNQETRLFFDVTNQPMKNIKGVYKEVYSFDEHGFKYQLNFFDQQNQPMESRWKISNYQWFEKNNWVIENRFNLQKEKQPLAPYFHFATTAIEYDAIGNPRHHFNLNEKLEVVNNKNGVAYYQDTYSDQGIHQKFAYFNQNKKMTLNQWGFAYGIKHYDEFGNYLNVTRYNSNDEAINPSPKTVIPATTSAKDKAEIKRISSGYLIALQQRKPELMTEVMHKKLSKHTVATYGDGGQYLRATTYDDMQRFAKSWNSDGTKFPPQPNNNVTILDSYKNIATVKLVSDNWYEYLHLIKVNGKWQIKNLVWENQ